VAVHELREVLANDGDQRRGCAENSRDSHAK
jgi:hypothetical protein